MFAWCHNATIDWSTANDHGNVRDWWELSSIPCALDLSRACKKWQNISIFGHSWCDSQTLSWKLLIPAWDTCCWRLSPHIGAKCSCLHGIILNKWELSYKNCLYLSGWYDGVACSTSFFSVLNTTKNRKSSWYQCCRRGLSIMMIMISSLVGRTLCFPRDSTVLVSTDRYHNTAWKIKAVTCRHRFSDHVSSSWPKHITKNFHYGTHSNGISITN